MTIPDASRSRSWWERLIEAEPLIDFGAWGERWLGDAEDGAIGQRLLRPEAQRAFRRVIVVRARAAGTVGAVLVCDDVPCGAAIAAAPGAPGRDLESIRRRCSGARGADA